VDALQPHTFEGLYAGAGSGNDAYEPLPLLELDLGFNE